MKDVFKSFIFMLIGGILILIAIALIIIAIVSGKSSIFWIALIIGILLFILGVAFKRHS